MPSSTSRRWQILRLEQAPLLQPRMILLLRRRLQILLLLLILLLPPQATELGPSKIHNCIAACVGKKTFDRAQKGCKYPMQIFIYRNGRRVIPVPCGSSRKCRREIIHVPQFA